jgi:hypothetical protein
MNTLRGLAVCCVTLIGCSAEVPQGELEPVDTSEAQDVGGSPDPRDSDAERG